MNEPRPTTISARPCDIDRASRTAGTPAPGPRRRCGENHRRGGVEVIPPVMLSNSKDVEPYLIGMLDLLDQVAHAVRRADRQARLVVCRCKAVDANLYYVVTCHVHHAQFGSVV